jgi:hypothetical protein
MRYFFTLLLAVFLALAPAGAFADGGTYYVDFTCSGCDSTGAGTWDDPWGTIGKCTTDGATTGGGECRVAKMTPTALSGTITCTNGSATCNTSADLTSELAVDDYIGLNNGLVSAEDEGWWKVSARDGTTITLYNQYWGPGTASAETGYLLVSFTLADGIDLNSSGTSTASRLKVSGGWSLSASSTQDGITSLYAVGTAFYWLSTNSNDYIEFSNFVVTPAVNASYCSAWGSHVGWLYKDIAWVNYQFALMGGDVSDFCYYENFIQSGGTGYGCIANYQSNVWVDGMILYSPGTAYGDYGLYGSQAASLYINDLEIYNAYHHGVVLVTGAAYMYFSDLIVDSTAYGGSDCVYINGAIEVFFYNPTISNCDDDAWALSDPNNDIYIYSPASSGLGGDEYYVYALRPDGVEGKALTVKDNNGTVGDDRMYFSSNISPAYIQRDTTDARTGTCLKFYVSEPNGFLTEKIGTFKVTDGSSNVTPSIYMKDNAGFDGVVMLFAMVNSKVIDAPVEKTMTTSYAESTITVSSADIATDDYLHLYIQVSGSTGNVFVDDFSATNP